MDTVIMLKKLQGVRCGSKVSISKNKPTDAHCLVSHAQPLLSWFPAPLVYPGNLSFDSHRQPEF